jgi:hypothetical protein
MIQPESTILDQGILQQLRKYVIAGYVLGGILIFIGWIFLIESQQDQVEGLSSPEQKEAFFYCMTIGFSGAITIGLSILFRHKKGTYILSHDKLELTWGRWRNVYFLKDLEKGSRKNQTLTLHFRGIGRVDVHFAPDRAGRVQEYLYYFNQFSRFIPMSVWRQFTFRDFYDPKVPIAKTVRFFKTNYTKSYVDCGWLVTLKKTTYFFPLVWPLSYGQQSTGFIPPSGFPSRSEVVPEPLGNHLHLLLKTILISKLPAYQKEFILSEISRIAGGGAIHGPLYHLFGLRNSTSNGLVYMDVPLQWARHVQVKEPELQ